MLVDAQQRLTGIFTDSDLARLLEDRRDSAFDAPIRDVMTSAPRTVVAGMPLLDACQIMTESKLSELPVVDDQGCPIGMIDITDVFEIVPQTTDNDAEATPEESADAPTLPFSRNRRGNS